MTKPLLPLTFLFALFINLQVTYAQKASGAEIPDYLLAENANPIAYIFTMGSNDVSHELGYIHRPDPNKSLDEYSNVDDGVFNSLTGAIEVELNELGIYPQGFVLLDMAQVSSESKVMELTEILIDSEPFYTLTFTISQWSDLKKAIKKAEGECTMDMITQPAFSVSLIGEMDYSKVYTVMGGKNLNNGFEFLNEEIKNKGEDYFRSTISEMQDIEALFSHNKEVHDLMNKEGIISESWPTHKVLKSSKTLVVCEDPTKKDKFMKYATGALEKNFSYDYEMVSTIELGDVDLTKYDFILVPKKKVVDKTKTVGMNGMRASYGEKFTREESYTAVKYYYQLKKIDDLQVYLGEDPTAITNFSMGNFPLALRRFMKVFSRE